MAAKAKKVAPFTVEEIKKAMEIIDYTGNDGGYVHDSVAQLLPPEERPRTTNPISIFGKIEEPRDYGNAEKEYTAAQIKLMYQAANAAWQPVDVDLGKAGVVTISLNPEPTGSVFEWF